MELLRWYYGAVTALPPPLCLPSGDLSGRQSMNPAIIHRVEQRRDND
jgi:hypothetical protein